MVLAVSHRISPVPRYSGYCSETSTISNTGLSPSAEYLSRYFSYRLVSLMQSYNPNLAVTILVWALSRSLATTWEIIVIFSSSGYLDVSVHRVCLHHRWIPRSLVVGCPIRISTDLRIFAPPRSFSQLITSFFASESLGIPHTLLLTSFLLTLIYFHHVK